MAAIRRLISPEKERLGELSTLLIDSVQNGASVGFLAPLPASRAIAYWEDVFASLGVGLVLWVAEQGEQVVGSVQLSLCQKENGRHRAEVQKLFVLKAFRGQGIASKLLADLESFARADGRTLLVLDTQTGSPAEGVYRHLGWQRAGDIPGYTTTPDGTLCATTYYFKPLEC